MLAGAAARAGAAGGERVPAAQVPAEVQLRQGISNFHAKATAGGPVRVAYLGGSITAADGWRVGTREFLRRTYPKAQVAEIFAAVSGTPSTLGVARLQRDVLDHRPDLLFVEFAVNDGRVEPARIERALEGIVRKTWAQLPRCDIVFVYTISKRMLPDYSAGRLNRSAAAMERVAEYYGVPAIAFGFEVSRRVSSGAWVFQADQKLGEKDRQGRMIFSHDGVHPLAAGHALYTDVVVRHWPALVSMPTPDAARSLGAALNIDHWGGAGLVTLAELELTGDWQELSPDNDRGVSHAGSIAPRTWRSTKAGNGVEVIVHGAVIGAVGYKNEKSSVFRVYVDDLPPVEGSFRDRPLGPHYRLKSWVDPRTHNPGTHRVRIEQLSGDEQGRELLLAGILFSGDADAEAVPQYERPEPRPTASPRAAQMR